jgi:hypothetical protein
MDELTAQTPAPTTDFVPPSKQMLPAEPDVTLPADTATPVATEPAATIPAPNPAEQPSPETPVPTVETPQSTDENSEQVNVAGKKVIKPINDIAHGPDLNDLLAKEAAKEQAGVAPATVAAGEVAAAPQVVAATDEPSFDPNSISL